MIIYVIENSNGTFKYKRTLKKGDIFLASFFNVLGAKIYIQKLRKEIPEF